MKEQQLLSETDIEELPIKELAGKFRENLKNKSKIRPETLGVVVSRLAHNGYKKLAEKGTRRFKKNKTFLSHRKKALRALIQDGQIKQAILFMEFYERATGTPQPEERVLLSKAYVKHGNYKMAEAILADTCTQLPTCGLVVREYCKLLIDRGSVEQAIRVLGPLAHGTGEYWPEIAGLLSSALEKQGDFEQARAVLVQRVDMAPLSVSDALQTAKVLVGCHRYEQAVAILEPIVASGTSRNKKVFYLLAEAFDGAGEPAKSGAVLADAYETWPSSHEVAVRYARFLKWCGKFSEAVAVLEPLMLESLAQKEKPLDTTTFVLLTRMYENTSQSEKATELAQRAFERLWANLSEFEGAERGSRDQVAALQKILKVARSKENLEKIVTHAHDIGAADIENSARDRIDKDGSGEESQDRIHSAVALPSKQSGILNDRMLLTDGSLYGNLLSTDKAVVIFTGIAGLNHTKRFLPMLHRLEKINVATLLVRDRHRQASMNGFGSFFPDRKAAVEGIRGILAENGYENVATIGFSLGGLAAILYGIELQAAGVLSLSGVTYFATDEYERRASAIVRRVQELKKSYVKDLLPLVRENKKLKIHAYYPDYSKYDKFQTTRLDGLDNVKTIAVPQAKHMVWEYWDEEAWTKVLNEFFEDVRWPVQA